MYRPPARRVHRPQSSRSTSAAAQSPGERPVRAHSSPRSWGETDCASTASTPSAAGLKSLIKEGAGGSPVARGARAVGTRTDGAHQHLVTVDAPIVDPHWEVSTPTLDEIVLTYLERDGAHDGDAVATRHLEVV